MNNDFDNKKTSQTTGISRRYRAATVLGALATPTYSRGEPYSYLRESPRSTGTLGGLKKRPNLVHNRHVWRSREGRTAHGPCPSDLCATYPG